MGEGEGGGQSDVCFLFAEKINSSLWRLFPAGGRQREARRDFDQKHGMIYQEVSTKGRDMQKSRTLEGSGFIRSEQGFHFISQFLESRFRLVDESLDVSPAYI